jgi:plastocyanin
MNSKKNLIIGGIVLIALVAIGWLVLKDDSSVDNPSPSPTARMSATPTKSPSPTPRSVIHTVHLTAQGPQPKSVTIRAGDAVSFVNDTNTLFWPASDPYPANNACAGFDASRGLRRGEVYTLVFSSAKTCTYHNNLDPYNQTSTGTVIVR